MHKSDFRSKCKILEGWFSTKIWTTMVKVDKLKEIKTWESVGYVERGMVESSVKLITFLKSPKL
jgi:hypothetical protein